MVGSGMFCTPVGQTQPLLATWCSCLPLGVLCVLWSWSAYCFLVKLCGFVSKSVHVSPLPWQCNFELRMYNCFIFYLKVASCRHTDPHIRFIYKEMACRSYKSMFVLVWSELIWFDLTVIWKIWTWFTDMPWRWLKWHRLCTWTRSVLKQADIMPVIFCVTVPKLGYSEDISIRSVLGFNHYTLHC